MAKAKVEDISSIIEKATTLMERSADLVRDIRSLRETISHFNFDVQPEISERYLSGYSSGIDESAVIAARHADDAHLRLGRVHAWALKLEEKLGGKR